MLVESDTGTWVEEHPQWRHNINYLGFDGSRLPAIFHGLRGTMLTQVRYDEKGLFPDWSTAGSGSYMMVKELAHTVFTAFPELRWVDPADLQPKKFKIIHGLS